MEYEEILNYKDTGRIQCGSGSFLDFHSSAGPTPLPALPVPQFNSL